MIQGTPTWGTQSLFSKERSSNDSYWRKDSIWGTVSQRPTNFSGPLPKSKGWKRMSQLTNQSTLFCWPIVLPWYLQNYWNSFRHFQETDSSGESCPDNASWMKAPLYNLCTSYQFCLDLARTSLNSFFSARTIHVMTTLATGSYPLWCWWQSASFLFSEIVQHFFST